MAKLVVDGSILKCSFGAVPCALKATPSNVKANGKAVATVMDCMSNIHILSFGMCHCPAVIAAQGAPQPCIPPPGFKPWQQASKALKVNGRAALTTDSYTTCMYGGIITIKTASSVNVK